MKRCSVIILVFASITIGCAGASKKTPTVPRKGVVVAEGKGQLSFRALGDGLLSIYDIKSDSIIHSSAVKENDVVTLDPDLKKITIAESGRGPQTVHTDVSASRRYEFWFIPVNPATTRWSQ